MCTIVHCNVAQQHARTVVTGRLIIDIVFRFVLVWLCLPSASVTFSIFMALYTVR